MVQGQGSVGTVDNFSLDGFPILAGCFYCQLFFYLFLVPEERLFYLFRCALLEKVWVLSKDNLNAFGNAFGKANSFRFYFFSYLVLGIPVKELLTVLVIHVNFTARIFSSTVALVDFSCHYAASFA